MVRLSCGKKKAGAESKMALYYDLPVYRDTYGLVLMLFKLTKEFPKEFKYSLAENMRRDALVLVRAIYRANKAENKQSELEAFLDGFELLKLQIRLCVDMKLLPMRKQAQLSAMMDSIGRQVTGWKKTSR